jgi:hypothetical protein
LILLRFYEIILLIKISRCTNNMNNMKKTIIFIDTNVLLSLYDIGSDNLQKFEELL